MTKPRLRVGIDIGGTKTHAVAIMPDGEIVQQLRLATGFGPAAVVDTAVVVVTEIAALTGAKIADFESIGIGVPGAVHNGTVSHAVNLGLEGLNLELELATRLGRAVQVANNVNAAALGAFQLLEKDPAHSLAYLNLGTGLAAGLVLGGSLWRGSRGTAGEIGHIPIDPVGHLCACGQRGCLETVASGSAIARQWPTDDSKPARALLAAAAAGDPIAIEVKTRLIENVAAAVRILVLTVDVDSVVIGGGLSSLGPVLLADVVAVLESWERASPFLASIALSERVHIVPSEFPAAAIGAALVGAP